MYQIQQRVEESPHNIQIYNFDPENRLKGRTKRKNKKINKNIYDSTFIVAITKTE